MTATPAIVMAAAAALLGFFILLRLLFTSARLRLRRQVQARFADQAIRRGTLAASCFGLRSRGPWQLRGNGALLLLDHALIFMQIVPNRELEIPLDHITSLGYTKSFLGKGSLRPLLQVNFQPPGSQPDAAAFAMPLNQNLDAWRQAIEAAMTEHNTPHTP